MDVIERVFGVSPDGGSGLFELALLLLPIVTSAVAVACRRAHGEADRHTRVPCS
jgi:hypothetical protein